MFTTTQGRNQNKNTHKISSFLPTLSHLSNPTYPTPPSHITFIIASYDQVLTKSTLKSSSLRVSFFSEELGMPPPFSDVQKVVLRCPQILWLDMDVFMRPNCRILKEQLDLDKEGVKKLLLFFPAVLCYNPMTLQRACRQALAMLTGSDTPPLILMRMRYPRHTNISTLFTPVVTPPPHPHANTLSSSY